MVQIKWVKIRQYERGLYFRDREFRGVLKPGRYLFVDPLWRVRVDVCSVREPWAPARDLEVIVRSGALGDEARVLDLRQHERALVWIDGRFATILKPGLAVLWTVFRDVRTEVIDARTVRFEHPDLALILAAPGVEAALEQVVVDEGRVGMLFVDGRFRETLAPGAYAFWRGVGKVKVMHLDLREQVADVAGQEIMTADKVMLRINALVTFKLADPLKAVTEVDDHVQALYRQAQLALREVVGTRELDSLLSEREAVAAQLVGILRARVESFGVRVNALGIRDIILPGEMRDLLNKVTEARKAAEAALITRREETAAMRSQLNTARIMEGNPTLMRLRELEVLEKVAEKAKLEVVLSEQGLADRIVKLV
jgi:regulator of protease activity HflC (stomatin/prohibitin superfamily)